MLINVHSYSNITSMFPARNINHILSSLNKPESSFLINSNIPVQNINNILLSLSKLESSFLLIIVSGDLLSFDDFLRYPVVLVVFRLLEKYLSIVCESISDCPSILVGGVLLSAEVSFSLRVSRLMVILQSLWMEFRLLMKHPFHCV